MGNNKQLTIHYKRQKGSVEIKGQGKEVINQVWFDLISAKLVRLIILVALLLYAPKIAVIIGFVKMLKYKND